MIEQPNPPVIAVASTTELGEHPLWDERTGELVWVELLAGVVHRQTPDGSDRPIVVPSTVGAAGLRSNGGYVLAAGDAFLLFDEHGEQVHEAIRPEGMSAGVQFNDGAVDAAGRFFAGTTSVEGERNAAALYCLEADGSVRVVFDGVTESNGIAWSPDSTLMYYVDSGEQDVLQYDYDLASGTATNPRVFVSIDPADGVPDGLVVNAAGDLWVALWQGFAVRRYSAEAHLLDVVELPVSRVTCAGFGGQALTDLYVTTAWEGASRAERLREPEAGSVFRITGVGPGLPVARYAG